MRPKGTPIPLIPAVVALAPYIRVLLFFFVSFFLIIAIYLYSCPGDSCPLVLNYFLLFAFTGVMSYFVGISCTAYGIDQPWVVYEAFAITAAMFVSITAFTIQTRIKLEFNSGCVLYCSLWALILMGWLRIFVFPESSLLYTEELYVGVVLFSLYIVFDVSKICDEQAATTYLLTRTSFLTYLLLGIVLVLLNAKCLPWV